MTSLFDLASKLAAGGQLADEDARQLAATTDLATVGMVAAEARRVHGGDGVTFVRVAEFACGETLPDAGFPAAAGEVRITGTPASIAEAVATVRACAAAGTSASGPGGAGAGADAASPAGASPAGAGAADASARAAGEAAGNVGSGPVGQGPSAQKIQALSPGERVWVRGPVLTGFSLADLWKLAGGNATALRDLAAALKAAGLTAVADVAVDRSEQVADALTAVIAGGLLAPVARWDTTPADPVIALKAVRELQAKTNAFRAFAPLPRGPQADPPQTGYDGVKLVALSRVMLDNVPAIQVDWMRHGPKLAQVALLFGASDLDRVSPSDDSPLGHRRAPLEEVQRNITAAFLKPIERDGRFEKVAR